MKTSFCTKSNKNTNRIGFGTWQLNNPLWGTMSQQEGIDLVKFAISKGVNFFDTVPGYGGQSETKTKRTKLFDEKIQMNPLPR